MNKDELLRQIQSLAAQRLLTREELNAAYDAGAGTGPEQALTGRLSFSTILYYLGGAIVYIGISILIGQNWSALTPFVRILVTLGSGVAAYIAGVLFNRDERTGDAALAFFLIAALTIPVGLHVVFDQAGVDVATHGTQSLISGILLCTFAASYFVFRRHLFTLFSIGFGTWFFFSFTGLLTGSNPIFSDVKFFEYRWLAVGASYMLLGYSFSRSDAAALSGPLYGFGSLAFLSAGLALGGWPPNQNTFWEIIYPGLAFGIVFLGAHLKSRALLTFGSVFLMLYITKITTEYFTIGLGWPLALVLCGLLLIAVGYLYFRLSRKHLRALP